MVVEPTPQQIESVHQSYGRCCLSSEFFADFYDHLIGNSPEIGKMFSATNMAVQQQVLRAGIAHLLAFANENVIAKDKIYELGGSHSRDQLDVTPQLYSLWLDSLLETDRKHNGDCDDECETAWRAILTPGIEKMKSLY